MLLAYGINRFSRDEAHIACDCIINTCFMSMNFIQVHSLTEEAKFALTLDSLLDDHRNVITLLAEGFSECRKHIKVNMI